MAKKKTHGREIQVQVQVLKNSTGRWIVKEFDPNTLVGVVTLGTERSFTFHSTSFQSDTGFRFPRQGETVEVATTSSGALLSVHGK